MKKLISFCMALVLSLSVALAAGCSHSYTEWEIKEAATASSTGIKTRKCTKCDKREYESYYPQGTLYKGITGREKDVAALLDALYVFGYDVNTDGFYSEKTMAAVKAFQKDLGLEVTGIAYPETLNALDVRIDSPFSTVTHAGDLIRESSDKCCMAHYEWTPEAEFIIPCDKHADMVAIAESFADSDFHEIALSSYRSLITECVTGKPGADEIIAKCSATEEINELREMLIAVCAM